jgi:hypothetical protein
MGAGTDGPPLLPSVQAPAPSSWLQQQTGSPRAGGGRSGGQQQQQLQDGEVQQLMVRHSTGMGGGGHGRRFEAGWQEATGA